MFKVLKKKLIITMMFVAVAVVVGVLIKTLTMFHNINATVRTSQASNIRENYIKDVTVDLPNVQKVNKDLNLLADAKSISDNSQYNNENTNEQETIDSELENLSNNDINKQETVNFKLEKSSNNDTNKQETVSSELEKSSNNDINEQETVNSELEKLSNNDTNIQETVNYELEKSNNNTNKQEAVNPKLEKPNNNINNQAVASSQLEVANSDVDTENQNSTNAILEVEKPTIHYDRTTSIYANDNITLLRIEYYANNKLTYYSVVEQFDATTKSYIEKIYQCNRETNIDPLIRTDVYANGNLIKSY